VRHGYDPTEVERHVSELARAASEAQQRTEELTRTVEQLKQAAVEREKELAAAKPVPPPEPTFHDFGKRVGSILAMAEEEAEEMRAAAIAEVDRRLSEADTAAAKVRSEADGYAQDTRSAADEEAAKLREHAKR